VIINGWTQDVRANGFLKARVTLIGEVGAESTILAADEAPLGMQRILLLPDRLRAAGL
jgi:hypothetical protein